MSFELHSFALCVIVHPHTYKFALVKESRKRGIWLAGGHVEPGESFADAAIREAQEEAGIRILLRGILRVEHTLMSHTHARMRVIFYAEPADPEAPLKSVPDAESEGAIWATRDEIGMMVMGGRLRGSEPSDWCEYLCEGGLVYPLSVLAGETAPANENIAQQAGFRPFAPAGKAAAAGGADTRAAGHE